ncbi:hypothetical protein BASA60_001134 [Batrachochytrium salamandrivorans]|nr:hypothetical protein BASA60_001134 [Batrachochytrium salamandrivorans]
MRLSTGIILSILSTNVFAIEHPNGAHPGSLLARRAVVADTDGPFLQKRSGDEEQEEQKDQKKQKKQKEQKIKRTKETELCPRKGDFGEDLYPTPNYNDDTGEGNTDSPTYDSNQDRGATGGREDVHTDVDPDQEESSFADASQGSSSRVLGHIRKGLSHIPEYKLLYRNSAESPFRLKLPSSASDEQRKTYKSLQDEVQKSSKDHISAIMHAVESIFCEPESVVLEFREYDENMQTVFYVSISDIRSEYSRLLSSLGMSGSGHLANVDAHMILLRAYRCNLSGQLNTIKKRTEDTIKTPNQKGSSKFSSSTLGSNRLSETGSKPSEDAASSSTQSEDVASSNVQSEVAVAYDLVIL